MRLHPTAACAQAAQPTTSFHNRAACHVPSTKQRGDTPPRAGAAARSVTTASTAAGAPRAPQAATASRAQRVKPCAPAMASTCLPAFRAQLRQQAPPRSTSARARAAWHSSPSCLATTCACRCRLAQEASTAPLCAKTAGRRIRPPAVLRARCAGQVPSRRLQPEPMASQRFPSYAHCAPSARSRRLPWQWQWPVAPNAPLNKRRRELA